MTSSSVCESTPLQCQGSPRWWAMLVCITPLPAFTTSDGQVSFWLQPRQYTSSQFREAWDRIGRGDQYRAQGWIAPTKGVVGEGRPLADSGRRRSRVLDQT
jgi:hypothetical protein